MGLGLESDFLPGAWHSSPPLGDCGVPDVGTWGPAGPPVVAASFPLRGGRLLFWYTALGIPEKAMASHSSTLA